MEEFTAQDFAVIDEEEWPQAVRLAEILRDLYSPSSISDMGCATGLYLKPFEDVRRFVIGYELSLDGKANAVISPESIITCDVTQPMKISKTDLAICLEVLEHIPEEGAPAAIANLCKMSDRIVFSAARPGQGGHGHINCREKWYWEDLFEENGFVRNYGHERIIVSFMMNGYHLGWLTQNVMVFQPEA